MGRVHVGTPLVVLLAPKVREAATDYFARLQTEHQR